MEPRSTKYTALFHALIPLTMVVASCRARDACEEMRDVASEWNERCDAGFQITMGDLECSEADAAIAECLVDCFSMPCDATGFDECVGQCG
jgi:hypothetical protein